jgi:AcrR family transcriptional regulator
MNGRSLGPEPQRFSDRRFERGARRRRILDAAAAIFSVRGYHETLVAQIAVRADLAAGTIYLYFKDKADLYGSVVLEKMKEVVARLEAVLDSHQSAKSSLSAAVEALFSYHDANRQFFELFLHQQQIAAPPLNQAHWKEMEELKRRNLALIESCILRGQQSGELKPGDARLYAVAFLGITLQMIRQWIREGGEVGLIASAEFAAECFLNGAATRRS